MPTVINNKMRILYMHGLGTSGITSKYLRDTYPEICIPDMETGYYNLRDNNSILRSIFKTYIFWMFMMTSIYFTYQYKWIGFFFSVFQGFVMKDFIIKQGVRKAFYNCKAIQEEVVKEFKPDLIIGSSWGGAILSTLILEGTWTGDALLFAPAFYKVNAICNIFKSIKKDNTDNQSRIQIIQAYEDEMIPLEDPFRLNMDFQYWNNPNSNLLMINDKYGHCFTELIETNQLKTYVDNFNKKIDTNNPLDEPIEQLEQPEQNPFMETNMFANSSDTITTTNQNDLLDSSDSSDSSSDYKEVFFSE
jgi:hypothetical protein